MCITTILPVRKATTSNGNTSAKERVESRYVNTATVLTLLGVRIFSAEKDNPFR
jgi:hypothetical protein